MILRTTILALTGHPSPTGKKALRKKILRKRSTENKIEKETKTPLLTVSYYTPSVAKFFHPFFSEVRGFFSLMMFEWWHTTADVIEDGYRGTCSPGDSHKHSSKTSSRGQTSTKLFYQSEQRPKRIAAHIQPSARRVYPEQRVYIEPVEIKGIRDHHRQGCLSERAFADVQNAVIMSLLKQSRATAGSAKPNHSSSTMASSWQPNISYQWLCSCEHCCSSLP